MIPREEALRLKEEQFEEERKRLEPSRQHKAEQEKIKMDAELVGQEMIHELELTTNVYEKMAELLKKIDSLVSFSSDDKKLIRGAILRKAQEMLDRLNG